MEDAATYRKLVQDLIKEYGDATPIGNIELETIFDREQDRYQLVTVGWHNKTRYHGCVLHVDIKGDKIWIQHDGTEDGIATRLAAAGVPKDKIILAFHPPYKRPYTGFGVG